MGLCAPRTRGRGQAQEAVGRLDGWDMRGHGNSRTMPCKPEPIWTHQTPSAESHSLAAIDTETATDMDRPVAWAVAGWQHCARVLVMLLNLDHVGHRQRAGARCLDKEGAGGSGTRAHKAVVSTLALQTCQTAVQWPTGWRRSSSWCHCMWIQFHASVVRGGPLPISHLSWGRHLGGWGQTSHGRTAESWLLSRRIMTASR